MNKKWKTAAAEMTRLKEHYLSVRKSESVSVHKTLVYRALDMVCSLIPEAGDFYIPITDTIISNVCRPDSKDDYEKGAGRHYYCVTNSHGIKKHPTMGYYKNGIRKYAKSARSMLEEDYTMALTMYKSGFIEISGEYFARAIHMLSDICCLPHAAGMTYFSNMSAIHKAYESMAKAMYPDSVPEHRITKNTLHLLDSESGFGDALNTAAEAQISEPKELLSDPEKSIINRIYKAEEAVAAILYRFMTDALDVSGKSRYIISNSRISGCGIIINVTEKGLVLTENDKEISIRTDQNTICTLFRAAHRFNGLYTFSPVSDDKGRVIILNRRILRPFNPRKENIFYRIEAGVHI